ncbi:MAG: membrane dipeptidase [Holdemanella porci]
MLRNYYRLGVRMIFLTWNYPNSIGYPNFTPNKDNDSDDILRFTNTTDGLTEFGISYIKELECLGMIIDVFHLEDKGFYDIYSHSTYRPYFLMFFRTINAYFVYKILIF